MRVAWAWSYSLAPSCPAALGSLYELFPVADKPEDLRRQFELWIVGSCAIRFCG